MAKSNRRAEAIWMENYGRWQIKVQKDGERRTFYSTKEGKRGKIEAEKKADKWLEDGAEDMRFDKAWAEFLADKKSAHGTSNYVKLERIGRLYLLPKLKHKRISTITPRDWNRCIASAKRQPKKGTKIDEPEKPLSKRYLEGISEAITTFLTYARRARWDIERVEEGDLTIPTNALPKQKKRVLQPDSIRALFSEDTIIRYGKPVTAFYIHAWRFYVATGLRRGELCGLREAEDVASASLEINRSINTHKEETKGKNDNARRSMELSAVAQAIIADQRAMLVARGISSPWLFPDEFGERSDPNSIYKRWTTYRTQHGIESSIHEMRHTFVSVNKADMPIELLKGLVGHSVDMDTTGIYGHEIDGEKQRAARIVDEVFERILNPDAGTET